jgi:phosphatidate cytidylyltransferase
MKRVLTAAIAVPITVLITLFAPDWFFALAVGFVSALAVDEFLSLAEKKGIQRFDRWFVVSAGLVSVAFIGGPSWVLSSLAGIALLTLTVAIFTPPVEAALGRVGMGLGGVLYCAFALGFLVLIRETMSREWILILFLIIWIGDTAAYYCGRAFGKHLLAPVVSPKKTVEGAIAGLVGSVAVGTIGGAWFFNEPWPKMVVVSAVTAIAGQLGDLAESVLKRSVGVKDSSSILPGHGGILDRLDSLFFAAPVFYWFFRT